MSSDGEARLQRLLRMAFAVTDTPRLEFYARLLVYVHSQADGF